MIISGNDSNHEMHLFLFQGFFDLSFWTGIEGHHQALSSLPGRFPPLSRQGRKVGPWGSQVWTRAVELMWLTMVLLYFITITRHILMYHCITVIWCVSDLCGIWWFVKCVWLYGAHFPTYVQLKHDPSKEPLQRPRKAGKHGGWKNPHMVRHPRNLMWRFNMLWMRMEKVGKWFLKRIRFDSWEYVISIRIYIYVFIYTYII